MTEREPRRESRSTRKNKRRRKAEIRRMFAPTAEQAEEKKFRAVKRLSVLDIRLTEYLVGENQESTGAKTRSHDLQTSLQLGQFLAQKINQDIPDGNSAALGSVALLFIEREWIESALGLIKHDELTHILRNFLDMCNDQIQTYLEGRDQQHLTRLQEVKNKVIDPVTGALVAL